MEKICSKCKSNTSLEDFPKRQSSKDGRDRWCKECHKKNGIKNRQDLRNKNLNNPSQITHKKCSSCDLNKEVECFKKSKTTSDGYRSYCILCRKNKQKEKYATDEQFRIDESKRHAKIYLKNSKKIIDRHNKWAKENPLLCLQQANKRRAKKAGVEFSNFDLNLINEKYNNSCIYCEKTDGTFHYDHLMPLSKGGPHTIENIVLACESCNCRKHASTLEEWKERLVPEVENYTTIIKNIDRILNEK